MSEKSKPNKNRYIQYNSIARKTLIGNDKCIIEENFQVNEFNDNGACSY